MHMVVDESTCQLLCLSLLSMSPNYKASSKQMMHFIHYLIVGTFNHRWYILSVGFTIQDLNVKNTENSAFLVF